MTWLEAFLVTLVIEVPLAVVCLRSRARARVAVVAVVANAISHPLLCFVLLRALPGPFVGRVLMGEAVVILIEAVVYALGLRCRAAHALAASAFLNAASYLFGLAFLNAPA